MYSSLLFISSFICFFFALADSYLMLMVSRFALGFVGAGFVIGIRMIGEWFPARQVGIAEGIYGGWGNFGSAAAALSLPTVALLFGGDDGWRYAIGTTGAIALVYSFVYYKMARSTPKGSTYFKPRKTGAMEITSKGDFFLYLLMNIPMYAALAVLAWKLGPGNLGIMNEVFTNMAYLTLALLYGYQTRQIWRINKHVFTEDVPEIHKYKFKQVAILDLAYLVTFGSELAALSMLPLFFKNTFDLSLVQAGLLASGYAFMNLFACPSGGFFSDRFGRKKKPDNIDIRTCRRIHPNEQHHLRVAIGARGCRDDGLLVLRPGRRRRRVRYRASGQTPHDGAYCRHDWRLWQRRCRDLTHGFFFRRPVDLLPGNRRRCDCNSCRCSVPG